MGLTRPKIPESWRQPRAKRTAAFVALAVVFVLGTAINTKGITENRNLVKQTRTLVRNVSKLQASNVKLAAANHRLRGAQLQSVHHQLVDGCRKIHKLDLVLTTVLTQSLKASAHAPELPDLTPDQLKALETQQAAGRTLEEHGLALARAADCTTVKKLPQTAPPVAKPKTASWIQPPVASFA